jgi:hypothetical protein
MAERICRQSGVFPAYRKTLIAPLDADIEAGFDLSDIFIERAAEVGQLVIVDRREGYLNRPALWRRLGDSLCIRAVRLL